jgi:hypothetical protein
VTTYDSISAPSDLSACFCVGGPNCCIRRRTPERQPWDYDWYRPGLPADPVKCPECGAWWRGATHQCAQPITGTGTVPLSGGTITWGGTFPDTTSL